MRRMFLVAAVAVAVAVMGACATSARADYGNTSQYQVGISLNCDVPHSTVCDQFDGTGGFWGWYVFNNDGTGDAQLTGCGHVVGGIGGPGGAGAGHESVDFTWTTGPSIASPVGSPNGLDFYIVSDTTSFNAHGTKVTLPDQNVGDTGIPAYPGHYSFKPMPGLTANVTVSLNPQH